MNQFTVKVLLGGEEKHKDVNYQILRASIEYVMATGRLKQLQ